MDWDCITSPFLSAINSTTKQKGLHIFPKHVCFPQPHPQPHADESQQHLFLDIINPPFLGNGIFVYYFYSAVSTLITLLEHVLLSFPGLPLKLHIITIKIITHIQLHPEPQPPKPPKPPQPALQLQGSK